jgi:hypothetical protein
MKLKHSTVVRSCGKKIVASTWRTDSGKPASQTVTPTGLKSGKTTVTSVGGGKLTSVKRTQAMDQELRAFKGSGTRRAALRGGSSAI